VSRPSSALVGKRAKRARQPATAQPALDPRASNHGGHTPTPLTLPHVDQGARFDWYQATIDRPEGPADDGHWNDEEGWVPWVLGSRLGATITKGKPRHGYAVCSVLEQDGRVLAQVYERSAREGEVHVVTTSDACDVVVPLVRERFGWHRVSRADSAIDLRPADGFAGMDAAVLGFAVERNISHRFITDSAGGATRYLGAPSSETRLRVYKKSEELRAKHPDVAHEIPDGIVRAELQVRPGKRDAKQRLGLASAGDVWGFSQWSADLAALVLNVEAERAPTHHRKPTDWQRQLHWLGRQYGPAIRARADEAGFMTALAEVLAAIGYAPTVEPAADRTPPCCIAWRQEHYVGTRMGGSSAAIDAQCPEHSTY
jgi:hypothetical protein